MNERKDEQWLDEELRRAINTTRPEFDAEAWKQRHAEAYEALVARERATSDAGQGAGRTMHLTIRRLAVAAVILIGAAILLTRPAELARAPQRNGPESAMATRPVTPAPVRMLSLMSLRMAYQQGGQEALNRTLDTALKKLGPRPSKLSAQEVLSDLEG